MSGRANERYLLEQRAGTLLEEVDKAQRLLYAAEEQATKLTQGIGNLRQEQMVVTASFRALLDQTVVPLKRWIELTQINEAHLDILREKKLKLAQAQSEVLRQQRTIDDGEEELESIQALLDKLGELVLFRTGVEGVCKK